MPPIKLDPATNLQQYHYFPDLLPGGIFRGFEDRDDPTVSRGAFVLGQNVKIGLDSLPVTRDGYEVLGTEAANSTPVQRAWVFETRDGAVYELKAYDTRVDYWLRGTSTDWALLKGGFTAGLEFGYGNIGESGADYFSYFCNGTDDWYQFNGAVATISSAGVNTLTIGSSTWTALGFFGTGTRSVIINGIEYAYTGGEGTATLTGVTPDPNGVVLAGAIAVQSPRVVSAMSTVKGQVVAAHDGRLHARLETEKSVWNYSKLDNPDDWATGATDGDGGTKDIEGSGGVVAFGKLNQTMIGLKQRIIKTLSFVASGSYVDVPVYTTLVSTDDKSTTLGATNQRSTFSTPYGLVFVTPDKRLILLTGITANNQPDYLVLSDPIQPIFDRGVHDDATGIVVDNVLYYAFKSSISSSYNDVVVRGNMSRQSMDRQGRTLPIRWDTPIVGWTVKDWTAVYNENTGKHEVHWHSSLNSSSYRIIEQKVDNTNPFGCSVRTWAETFDAPTRQKIVDRIWCEVRMSTNTELLLTVLYDENGVTGQEEHTLLGSDLDSKFDVTVYNPFGFNPFGSQVFGSEPESTQLPLYRFEILLKANIRFFNISLQFSTEEPGNDFQIVRFGHRLKQIIQETDRKYLTE
jgi:hypothetical protein